MAMATDSEGEGLLASTDDDARSALLDPPGTNDTQAIASTATVRRQLYISHFLSTWNARLFEFGAYLFLAEIYPHTLLPASVYALTRAGSAALLSPWLGRYVDVGERLNVVRWSIGKQPPYCTTR